MGLASLAISSPPPVGRCHFTYFREWERSQKAIWWSLLCVIFQCSKWLIYLRETYHIEIIIQTYECKLDVFFSLLWLKAVLYYWIDIFCLTHTMFWVVGLWTSNILVINLNIWTWTNSYSNTTRAIQTRSCTPSKHIVDTFPIYHMVENPGMTFRTPCHLILWDTLPEPSHLKLTIFFTDAWLNNFVTAVVACPTWY